MIVAEGVGVVARDTDRIRFFRFSEYRGQCINQTRRAAAVARNSLRKFVATPAYGLVSIVKTCLAVPTVSMEDLTAFSTPH